MADPSVPDGKGQAEGQTRTARGEAADPDFAVRVWLSPVSRHLSLLAARRPVNWWNHQPSVAARESGLIMAVDREACRPRRKR